MVCFLWTLSSDTSQSATKFFCPYFRARLWRPHKRITSNTLRDSIRSAHFFAIHLSRFVVLVFIYCLAHLCYELQTSSFTCLWISYLNFSPFLALHKWIVLLSAKLLLSLFLFFKHTRLLFVFLPELSSTLHLSPWFKHMIVYTYCRIIPIRHRPFKRLTMMHCLSTRERGEPPGNVLPAQAYVTRVAEGKGPNYLLDCSAICFDSCLLFPCWQAHYASVLQARRIVYMFVCPWTHETITYTITTACEGRERKGRAFFLEQVNKPSFCFSLSLF